MRRGREPYRRIARSSSFISRQNNCGGLSWSSKTAATEFFRFLPSDVRHVPAIAKPHPPIYTRARYVSLTDAQGKVFSTALLRMVLDVPDAEARQLNLPAAP